MEGCSGRQTGITKSFSLGLSDSSTRPKSFSNVLGLYSGWSMMCFTCRCCSSSSERRLQCFPGPQKVCEAGVKWVLAPYQPQSHLVPGPALRPSFCYSLSAILFYLPYPSYSHGSTSNIIINQSVLLIIVTLYCLGHMLPA